MSAHVFPDGARVVERAYPDTLGTVVDHAADGWTFVRWDRSGALLSYPPSDLAEPSAEQLRIGTSGQIESQPLTWDGEPLYSPNTVREAPHLFSPEAFEQIHGQLAIEEGGHDGRS